MNKENIKKELKITNNEIENNILDILKKSYKILVKESELLKERELKIEIVNTIDTILNTLELNKILLEKLKKTIDITNNI